MLKEYTGPRDKLDLVDSFALRMAEIPRLQQRLETIRFKKNFEVKTLEIAQDVKVCVCVVYDRYALWWWCVVYLLECS